MAGKKKGGKARPKTAVKRGKKDRRIRGHTFPLKPR